MSVGSPNGLRVVDADGHVNEPPDLWARYLPAEFVDRAPKRVRDEQGRTRNVIDGEMLEPIPMAPEWSSPDRPTGGWDPQARLADMDAEGIAEAVLFPTTGLFFAGIGDAALETALCRAYNDWLFDYAAADRNRLIGIATIPQHDVDAACRGSAPRGERSRCPRDHGAAEPNQRPPAARPDLRTAVGDGRRARRTRSHPRGHDPERRAVGSRPI